MKKYLAVILLLAGVGACKMPAGPDTPQFLKVRVRSITASLTGANFVNSNGAVPITLPIRGDYPYRDTTLGDTSSYANTNNSGYLLIDKLHLVISGQLRSWDSWGMVPNGAELWSDMLQLNQVPYYILHDSILLVDVLPTKELVPLAAYHHAYYWEPAPHDYHETHEDYTTVADFDGTARLKLTIVFSK